MPVVDTEASYTLVRIWWGTLVLHTLVRMYVVYTGASYTGQNGCGVHLGFIHWSECMWWTLGFHTLVRMYVVDTGVSYTVQNVCGRHKFHTLVRMYVVDTGFIH